MKESFITTGDFFTNSGVPRVEPWKSERRPWALINFVFWLISILIPMLYYLVKLLFSGEILYFSVGSGLIFSFYMLMQRTLAMTETRHGSSYGTAINTHQAKAD